MTSPVDGFRFFAGTFPSFTLQPTVAILTLPFSMSLAAAERVIFSFSDAEEISFKKNLHFTDSALNSNVTIITPTAFKMNNRDYSAQLSTVNDFSLKSMNIVFDLIRNSIPNRYGK